MAGSLTDYTETALLNALLRGTTFPAATGSVYISLYTVAPTDAGGGTEVTGGSYARVAVSRATGSWDAPADQSGSQKTANTAAVTFASPTANWGAVVAMGWNDASTAGNLLAWADLDVTRTIQSGDNAPSFAAGTLALKVG